MPDPIPKDGSFVSPVYIAWVKRQPCLRCPRPRYGVDPHHYPSTGAAGARRDDRAIPLCREHHEMAQLHQIPDEVQGEWVHRMRSWFLESASDAEWEAFSRDRRRWRESRVFAEIPH